jgi:hypothetical protein
LEVGGVERAAVLHHRVLGRSVNTSDGRSPRRTHVNWYFSHIPFHGERCFPAESYWGRYMAGGGGREVCVLLEGPRNEE